MRARDPSWRPAAVLTNPVDVESDIARYQSWRNDARARLDELPPRGIGDNNPSNPRGIIPTLSGRRAKISERDDAETRRGLYRENESADILYAYGHNVEQKPIIEGRKNPDFLIDGEVFDNYAPITRNLRSIWGYIDYKVQENQAKSIILNLRDSLIAKDEIEQMLIEYPIEGLNRLWVLDRKGNLHYLLGGKRWE